MIVKHKKIRLLIAAILSFTLILGVAITPSYATSYAPKIEDVDYDGGGRVEVDFYGKVKYKNVKVTVKDSSGKSYTAKIYDRDRDELDFRIIGVKAGKTYTFKIKGIKKSTAKKYGTVTHKIKVPSNKSISVKDIDYDSDDRELTIEFKNKVSWKSPKVTVTDSNGKSFATRITDRDNDEIDVHISGLTWGKTYKYKITGIKAYGSTSYTTKSGSFKAVEYDD